MIRLSGTKKKRKIGHEKTLKWRVELILISWLAVLGFDFLLHAGLLARVYARESPALLSAEHAFYRIPFGYLSYLILVVLACLSIRPVRSALPYTMANGIIRIAKGCTYPGGEMKKGSILVEGDVVLLPTFKEEEAEEFEGEKRRKLVGDMASGGKGSLYLPL